VAHATPYKVAQNIFLHMTVRRDAHKKLVREFEHHHDSLVGELLQLQQKCGLEECVRKCQWRICGIFESLAEEQSHSISERT
jgi:hypothetical protein